MNCLRLLVLPFMITAADLAAQGEPELRDHFEGRTVVVKLDMPGTEDGVDIFPGAARPLDFPKYAQRLKSTGTAIKTGQSIIVTKVRVKSKHIEFQLGGGGYGTFGDETEGGVPVSLTDKSQREKDLDRAIRNESDPSRKKQLERERDDLRRSRELEDRRNQAAVADAAETRKQVVRQRRLEGGSRFNVRYPSGIPASALTPSGLQSALAEYVDFSQLGAGVATAASPNTLRSGDLRKGLLLTEVESLLGPAASATERREGSLTVATRSYRRGEETITAEFVESVLIRYSVSSR